jgi:hypothetical protein
MQNCWNCNTDQFDGAIFCSDCGASLVSKKPHRETTASLSQLTIPGYVPDFQTESQIIPEPPVASSDTPVFSLVVLNSGQRLNLEPNRNLLLGRLDKNRGIMPDVNLSDLGGYDSGVSRRHALLSLHEGQCLLEDLGSANGTFINNQQLSPNQPRTIKSGDEVKFGTLLMRIEF